MTVPIVFIPGMMCDSRLFTHQTAAILDRTVMSLPIEAYETIEALAEHCLAQAPPQFALAGLSMGGIVAMEMLRQAPERVDRLCLMDTNALAEAEEVKARREPQIQRVLGGELREVMQEELKPNYLSSSLAPEHRKACLDLCMEMALELGMDVFVRQSRALKNRRDQCETLNAYTGQTLILHGAEDRLCPPERHLLMHRLMPHAKLQIIANAGHLPSIEQPDATTQALKNWLM